MKPPDEKFEILRQQVIAKVHWGAMRREVSDWLQTEHGITGAEAERLFAEADDARRKAIRQRALIRLGFSTCGLLLALAFFYVRFFSGVIFYGPGAIIATAFAIVVGFVSVSTLVRSLMRLLTGEAAGSVD